MRRDYHNGHSQSLNRDMELVAYGHAGVPLLVFPTLGGRFYEYEDQGMIQPISSKIENGELNVFCVDSVDKESWQNVEIHAYQRVMRHFAYEAYILNDVLPLIRATTSPSPLSVTGCGFGGYHAFNLAMKHPDLVARCVSMSGSFNIKPFVDTYYDNNVYFNNPVDYYKPERPLVSRPVRQHAHCSGRRRSRLLARRELSNCRHTRQQRHSP